MRTSSWVSHVKPCVHFRCWTGTPPPRWSLLPQPPWCQCCPRFLSCLLLAVWGTASGWGDYRTRRALRISSPSWASLHKMSDNMVCTWCSTSRYMQQPSWHTLRSHIFLHKFPKLYIQHKLYYHYVTVSLRGRFVSVFQKCLSLQIISN